MYTSSENLGKLAKQLENELRQYFVQESAAISKDFTVSPSLSWKAFWKGWPGRLSSSSCPVLFLTLHIVTFTHQIDLTFNVLNSFNTLR